MNDIVLNTFFETTGLSVGTELPQNSSTPYLWAGLASPASGLYQINFAVPQPPSNLQSCTQSTEWFSGSANMIVNVFRQSTLAVTTGVATISTGDFVTFLGAPTNSVTTICVAL